MRVSPYSQQSHTGGTERLILCSHIPRVPLFWPSLPETLETLSVPRLCGRSELLSFQRVTTRQQQLWGAVLWYWLQMLPGSALSSQPPVFPLLRLTPQLPPVSLLLLLWSVGVSVGHPRALCVHVCVAWTPLCVSSCRGMFVLRGNSQGGWKALPLLQEGVSPLRS